MTSKTTAAFASVQVSGQRLQNVFRVLANPNHRLRNDALKLREDISSNWRTRAAEQQWFAWPSTNAPPGVRRLSQVNWRPIGMLSFLGYRVGELQPTLQDVRLQILEYAFECHLPPLIDSTYHREWSEPLTAHRLKKIADSLASFARNAKRRNMHSWTRAIDDWETDLEFLFEKYYDGYFHFWWPATGVLH
jgi:hypothetical protein